MKIKNYALIPLIVALITSSLAALSYGLEEATARHLFSEQGFFERMSPVMWIAAGLYALWHVRVRGKAYLALGLTFIALALREWDHHKTFTSDSILKINFYQDHGFGAEQLFGGLAALVIIGLVIATLVILTRYSVARRGYETRGGQFLIAGLGMLVLSKIMDRAPSILRDNDVALDGDFTLMLLALEEWFEFFCPALILIGVIYKIKSETPQPLLP
jgi:hypothetical protein